MSKEIIYVQRIADGTVSMFGANEDTTDIIYEMTITIGPWDGDQGWSPSARGTVDFELRDTGNGIEIVRARNGKTMTFEYGELDEIAMLFDAWSRASGYPSDIKRFVEADE